MLLLALLLLTASTSIMAQQKFPDWMDEVDFKPSGKQGINEPLMPVDPATGQPATSQSPRKGFKPELPDFKKMREKALKLEMEKKQSETNSLEQSYNLSLKNVKQLKTSKNRLEELLTANPGTTERLQLLEALKELENKIKLSEELQSLIGASNTSSTPDQVIANLTAEQFARALKLQKQLFSDKGPGTDKIGTPTRPLPPAGLIPMPETTNAKETDEEIEARAGKLRNRPYRPGRIKSFYRETIEAQKKAAEEGNND